MQLLIILSIISYNLESFEVLSIVGHSLTAFDITTLMMTSLFIKKIFWDGVELKIAKNPVIIFYIMLHLSVVLSGITPLISGDHRLMIQFLKSFSHFQLTLLFATVVNFDEIKNDTWIKAIQLWLIIVVFLNIFGIYQILARAYNLPFAWINLTSNAFKMRGLVEDTEITQLSLKFSNFYRATSIYPEPSALATVNVITLIFLAIPLLTKSKPFFKSKLFNIFQITVSIIALFLTFSLTGLMGLGLVFSFLLLIEFKSVYKKYLFALVFAATLIITSDLIVENLTGTSVVELFSNRVLTITGLEKDHSKAMSGESFYWRASNLQYSIEAGLKSPFFGNGLGLTFYATDKVVVFSDSAIAAVICELGLVGTIAFTGMWVIFLYYGFKLYKMQKSNPDKKFQQLYVILPYLIIFFIAVNYFVANQLINMSIWLFMSMFTSIINNNLIEEGKYYNVKLLKRPIKDFLNNSTKAYLTSNKDTIN